MRRKPFARAPGARPADDHQVRLLQGAEEFFPALIEAMDAAMADIQFETYIFDFTGAGATVAQALMRAAARGVRTHLVVDGVGTGALPKVWAEQFQAAGVLWSVYSPLGPLVQLPDAELLDTSAMGIEETVKKVLDWYRKK